MKLRRRRFLQMTAGAGAALAIPQRVQAQAYPSREVSIIVGFPPGGPLDLAARVMAPWLTGRFGQAFVVKNHPGASGNVATQEVVEAAPDGYTLLLCGPVNTINTTLFEKLGFDFARDITPVAGIARVPLVVEVNPSVAARSVPEFLAYARANPGRLKVAYAGVGTPQHVAIELFQMMAGVRLTLVPYPGSAPALVDLLRGEVQVMFDPLPSSIEHIRAAKLIPLAVTSTVRSETLPDTPVMSDYVPGYEGGSWFGIGAPRNTPAGIIDTLNKTISAGVADAKIKAQLVNLGAIPMPFSPAEFGRFITAETEKYRDIIRAAGIKPQ